MHLGIVWQHFQTGPVPDKNEHRFVLDLKFQINRKKEKQNKPEQTFT